MGEPKLAQSEYKEQKRLAAGLSRSLCYLVEIPASQIAALQLGDTRTQQFGEETSSPPNMAASTETLYGVPSRTCLLLTLLIHTRS